MSSPSSSLSESVRSAGPGRSAHLIEVSFEGIADPKERRYFYELPTSFALEDEQVDRLRQIAGRLLRDSPEFRKVLQELGATPRLGPPVASGSGASP